METASNEAEGDLLHGYEAIAKFLGLTPRQVAWHDEHKRLPTFRIGRSVCARKSTLSKWLAEQEAKAT